jgi:MEMO1 family protein
VSGVRKRLRKKSFLGDFSHRSEHSIELQVIFLQHLLEGRRAFKIVPVLVGSFQQMIDLGSSPEEDLLVKDYIKAIRAQIEASGKKTLLIASADLAHLGPKYGDQETYPKVREDELKADDEKMFSHLANGDAEGFFQEVSRIKDARKICGLGAIYFITRIAEPSRGELLKWSVWWDEQTGSAVSFCAMALY